MPNSSRTLFRAPMAVSATSPSSVLSTFTRIVLIFGRFLDFYNVIGKTELAGCKPLLKMKNRKTIQIEWGDCDPAQIVYFPRYFAYFDSCTTALFKKAGLVKREML